jgi:uncharacterized protein (TIGR03437 family)
MQIGHIGGGNLPWKLIASTSNDANFLKVSADSGTGPTRLNVEVVPEALPDGGRTPGVYTTHLLFVSEGSMVTVPVVVRVGDGDRVGLRSRAAVPLAAPPAAGTNLWPANTQNCLCGSFQNQDTGYGDFVAAPDGTNTAQLVFEANPGSGSVPHYEYLYGPLGPGQLTLSFHLKAGVDSWAYITSVVDGVARRVWFNLSGAGAVGAALPPGWSAQIDSVGNGWYRCSVTFTATNSAVYNGFGLATGDGVYNYVGTIGNGVYEWGHQAETGTLSAFKPNVSPCLHVESTQDVANTPFGAQIGFVISVTNRAAGSAGVAIGATLDVAHLPGAAGMNWSISPAYSGQGTCAVTGSLGAQALHCDLGNLPGGSSATVHIISPTTYASCGSYSVQATASPGSDAPAGAIEYVTITSCAPSGWTISKTHTGNFATGQNGATYTVTVSNGAGGGPTSGTVTVTDTAPVGLTLVSMNGAGWTCPNGSNACNRNDSLNPGSSYPPITVTVNVAPNAPAQVTNQVSVSGGGAPTASASDPTNVTNTCLVTVNPVAPGVPGTAGTLTLTFTNGSCGWTAVSNASWLTPEATSGTAGTLNVAVAANTTGGQRMGTMTVAGQTITVTQAISNAQQLPSLVSLNPFQGSGPNATLTLVYAHSSGWAALRSAEFIMNPRWETTMRSGGCYVKYAPATGLFTLINDDGNSVAGTAAPGSASNISNSQCTLHAANSSATGSGNNLTLVVSLTFSASFGGQRHIWMQASDYNNATTNWLVYGVWFPSLTTVSAGPWYRIYDPFSKSYLYSADQNEYNTLGARGFQLQGISGLVMNGPSTVGGTSNIAWYRVFVNSTNSHFWTSDRNEFLTLINLQQAYVGEGVAAFVVPYLTPQGQFLPQPPNMIPFWRAVYTGANLHFWTSDQNEYENHLPGGYAKEGIACYIFPASGATGIGTTSVPASETIPAGLSEVSPTLVASSPVVAPGQLLSVYGRHLSGQVLFNGIPADVVSMQDNEIRVVVPKELGDVAELSLEVRNPGLRSKPLTLGVVAANPALFGTNQYGKGNAQARNEDGTTNDPQHAAARGSLVTLFSTGFAAGSMPVEVHVGGRAAELVSTYNSPAQPGVIEVRVRVPDTVEAADFQPVVLQVGNLFSQPGIGLAIR